MAAPGGEQRLEGALLGDRQVGPVGVGGLELDVQVADRAEPAGDLAQAASGSAASGPSRKPSPKTRQAARWRRVATRILWRSSASSPVRVPAS